VKIATKDSELGGTSDEDEYEQLANQERIMERQLPFYARQ
jgi:hypothetical protein